MKEKINLEELEKLLEIASSSYSWFFWSQHPDKSIEEETGIKINFRIKEKEVEVVDEFKQSHGVYSLQELVGVAKSRGKDVIALSKNNDGYLRVMVERFSSFQELYVSEIGLYSKKRPWIIKTNKANSKGIKVVKEGYPRSRDKVNEGDLRNENELLHSNHLEQHRCALKEDGRVLKRYRKSIKTDPKNFICNEIDAEFISELIHE